MYQPDTTSNRCQAHQTPTTDEYLAAREFAYRFHWYVGRRHKRVSWWRDVLLRQFQRSHTHWLSKLRRWGRV